MSSKKSKRTSSERHSAVPQSSKPKSTAASKPEAVKMQVSAAAAEPVQVQAGGVDQARVSSLIAALRDSSADVAREAAISLGTCGDASAVEPLIAVLKNTDGYFHSVVRAGAAQSLGQLADRRAVEPLVGAIHDSMAEASAEAVRALAQLKDPRAIEPLVEVVRNSGGFFLPVVRRAAVLALAKLGGPAAAEELAAVAANSDEDPIIRKAAQDSAG